jgi:hypothetical protein
MKMPTLFGATFAIAMSVCGCSKDPLSSAYSARPPAVADLAGTYVPDSGSITTTLATAGNHAAPVINLLPDCHISITGMKDLGFKTLDGQTVEGDGFQGTWDVGRNDEHWVILAEAVQILIVRDKPPYGLEMIVGKPGRERVLRFERQSPVK